MIPLICCWYHPGWHENVQQVDQCYRDMRCAIGKILDGKGFDK